MAASRSISECFSTPHAEPLTENTPSAARQERLARLVQRLRRQVRGEVQLVAGMARLLPVDSSDVPAALAMARELAVPVYMGAGAPGRHRAGGACVAGMPGAAADPWAAAREALELADGGMRLKSAAGQAAGRVGLRPNEVYRAALVLRDRRAR